MFRRLGVLILSFFIIFWPKSGLAKLSNDPQVKQWSYEDTGVYTAWNYSVGSSRVVVAVIDNGFDYLHPDLRNNVWVNVDEIPNNKIDDDKNGYVDDVYGWNFVGVDENHDGTVDANEEKGNNDPRPDADDLTPEEVRENVISHGTVVAGIIGATGDNNTNGVGINWRVRLMNLKVVDNGGSGSFRHLAEAIRYAADNGADVINLSMVGSELPDELKPAALYAYKKGVSIVAAAGNDMSQLNNKPVYPVCLDAGDTTKLVLGVSAIDENHYLALFSNIGSNCIDLTAPGVFISSTQRWSPTNGLTGSYGGQWEGTSFAAPFVSGAVALIKSLAPAWGPAQIYDALLKTVHHTPSDDEADYANLFGAGLLQIDEAVKYVNAMVSGTIQSKKIVVADTNGLAVIYDLATKKQTEEKILSLKNAKAIASYEDDGKNYFVVLTVGKKDEKIVIFYDLDWNKIRSWNFLFGGEGKIAVADLNNDRKKEVVFWPTGESGEVFRVFDLTGQELKQVKAKKTHQGVGLSLMSNLDNDQKKITALYYEETSLALHEFDRNFNLIKSMAVSFPAKKANLAIGDIDGDGTMEYVIGAPIGVSPRLGYYSRNGQEKRLFYPYDSYLKGYDLSVMDINNDGKDEVIILPLQAGAVSRILNEKGKDVVEKMNLVKEGVGGVKTMVY